MRERQQLAQRLRPVAAAAKALADRLSDTTMEAESEAWHAATSLYSQLTERARNNPSLAAELAEARATAKYLGTDHHELVVKPDAAELLPKLAAMGAAAVKIEGRQRSPRYVETVTRVWRAALDECAAQPQRYRVRPAWQQSLAEVSEGSQCTLGAYHRPWK